MDYHRSVYLMTQMMKMDPTCKWQLNLKLILRAKIYMYMYNIGSLWSFILLSTQPSDWSTQGSYLQVLFVQPKTM